jgi:hypothetical protein
MADSGESVNEPRDVDIPVEEPVVFDPTRPHVSEPRDASVDRAIIARILIGMMAVGLVVHYMAVIALEWNGKHDSVKSLETVLNAWLPIMSGLVGAAVTYYFTREK